MISFKCPYCGKEERRYGDMMGDGFVTCEDEGAPQNANEYGYGTGLSNVTHQPRVKGCGKKYVVAVKRTVTHTAKVYALAEVGEG